MMRIDARLRRLPLLLMLALSLSGCAWRSAPQAPPAVEPPRLPAPPAALMESPPQPWLPRVQGSLSQWRQTLTPAAPASAACSSGCAK